MKFHTFSGETPAEALKQAQLECGENALVISTKQIRKKTISSSALYEVVVAIEEDQPTPPPPRPEPRVEPKYKSGEDVLFSLSEAAKQISQIAQATSDVGNPSASRQAEKAQNNEGLGEIKCEINKLADKIKLIQEMFWEEKAPHRNNLAIPSEFSEIYKLAKTSGMGEDHLENIMNLTLEHMPVRMKNSSETIKRYFQVLLRKLIPVRVEPWENPRHRNILRPAAAGLYRIDSAGTERKSQLGVSSQRPHNQPLIS